MSTVIHRCDERGRDHRPDARQRSKPTACGMFAADANELGIELREAGFYVGELIDQLRKQLAGKFGQISLSYRSRSLLTEAPRTFGQHDAILGEKPSRVVYERGALDDQPLTHAM